QKPNQKKTDQTEGFLMEETKPKTVEDVETVDIYTAKGFLSTGHRYLDVRTNEEFAKGHVEDALNIPYMFQTDEGEVINPDFLPQMASVCKKDEHIIVACNAGGRGSRACIDLLNAGYKHVANMGGGYSAWVDAGFARGKPPEDLKIACKFRPKEIPGLYRSVQEQIKDQVANMYLSPKTLVVPNLDPAKAFRRPVGIVHVKVVKAVGLRKTGLMGGADPYVEIKLSEDKIPSKKTTVKHKNLNPEWNEEFKFSVQDPQTQVLEFNVYDWEQIGKHDKMGMNVLALKEMVPNEHKAFTLELRKTLDGGEEGQTDKYRGKLEVELLYKPFTEEEMPKGFEEKQSVQKAPEGTPATGGMLVVIVHSAEDVEGKHHTNPYVRIYFKGEERKTKQVKKNRDPRWNEEFSFMLEEPPVREKLHVEVLSTSSRIGLLHPKETLGYVDIPVVDVVNNKRMNQKFHLIDSKNGKIQIELEWRTVS
ncbi:unnamed protein product, partial [Arabidopsis halleri]